jgi:hypothetical protein
MLNEVRLGVVMLNQVKASGARERAADSTSRLGIADIYFARECIA